MAENRHIRKVSRSRAVVEGAGVHLRRAIGFGDSQLYDPFLLLDDFRSEDPAQYLKGFPWHPHRGMETITYVLRGKVEHKDSLGNGGMISAGDVQWMTAGSGILHEEMPKVGPRLLDGFQRNGFELAPAVVGVKDVVLDTGEPEQVGHDPSAPVTAAPFGARIWPVRAL